MLVQHEESGSITAFREWFRNYGGRLNDDLLFVLDSSGTGLAVRTRRSLTPGTLAASCPFSLTITLETIKGALDEYCRLSQEEQANLVPRQLICTYIALHDIIREENDEKCLLRHRSYLNVLPRAENLLTPLYFSDTELDIFRGTNLYGAALDQRNDFLDEWKRVRIAISVHSSSIADAFTFEMYQLAATYLSSRAFPSTLLSSNPSLVVTPSSYPVLLPGVDMFNHRRGQPVSWTISRSSSSPQGPHTDFPSDDPRCREIGLSVGLVIDTTTGEGEEVFNNYGPKPNSSLILGYGFALPDNPDDTIVLKVGSTARSTATSEGDGHEVGRNIIGAEAVWNDVRRIIAAQYGEHSSSDANEDVEAEAAQEIQIDLETAGALSNMVSSLITRLPDLNAEHPLSSVRKEVQVMCRYYVQGQKDILDSLLEWLDGKEREAVRRAEELGINIVGDESDEE